MFSTKMPAPINLGTN